MDIDSFYVWWWIYVNVNDNHYSQVVHDTWCQPLNMNIQQLMVNINDHYHNDLRSSFQNNYNQMLTTFSNYNNYHNLKFFQKIQITHFGMKVLERITWYRFDFCWFHTADGCEILHHLGWNPFKSWHVSHQLVIRIFVPPINWPCKGIYLQVLWPDMIQSILGSRNSHWYQIPRKNMNFLGSY